MSHRSLFFFLHAELLRRWSSEVSKCVEPIALSHNGGRGGDDVSLYLGLSAAPIVIVVW